MHQKKSVFRKPGAKHFQLVHRSQRDPLIHDPDAGQHVLKSFERQNQKKGKSRAELEEGISAEVLNQDRSRNVGEASLYGVYFDDTDYDYMQHLRNVGAQEDGVESILIEAPSSSQKLKGNSKSSTPTDLLCDLPKEVLPSTAELPRDYESQLSFQSSVSGFKPDMDPHLRQTLEALENDAFVDDRLEDDFFGELIADGELGQNEETSFEFHEDPSEELSDSGFEEGSDSWEHRFAQFKREKDSAPPGSDAPSDQDDFSEGEDTVGNLPEMSVIGGKKRRKATSDASGYSMSSSSMFRNEALQTLDARFDQILQKQYEEVKEEETLSDSGSNDSTPELITSRNDFENMMDDFLDNYELLGRKLKPKLEGESGVAKLETMRIAMGRDDRVKVQDDDVDEGIVDSIEDEEPKDRWDCETILTTYSNLENHPRLIRARISNPAPKIHLNPRTGLPLIEEKVVKLPKEKQSNVQEKSTPVRVTISRSRDENPEEKKARKQAVKMERSVRRVSKKEMKEQFSSELKHQLKGIVEKEKSKTRRL